MDEIEKSLIDGTIELRETLNEITMEKIEIVKKIIDLIGHDSSKETGIIKFTNEFRELKYYISLKELWSHQKDETPQRLAILSVISKELELVESVSEFELLVILNELECKTIESFKVIVE